MILRIDRAARLATLAPLMHVFARPFQLRLRYALARRLFGALAVFALLLNSLAPTITFVKAGLDGRTLSYAEICTERGIQLAALDAAASPTTDGATDFSSKGGQQAHDASCQFCANHAGSFALSDARLGWTSVAASRNTAPRLAADVHVALLPLWSPLARAPPAHA
jgi:hypothetical protein